MSLDRRFAEPATIQIHLNAIFVSLELSGKSWLITSLSPGGGEKMSKRTIAAGDVAGLLSRFAEFRRKAQERTGTDYPIVVIQEAGLDGFWLHRVLEQEGCESHVVDPGSVAVPRRRRRAKSDRIDGETLLRVLLAFKRGEPRVCSMVRAPTPEAEDERRIGREREALIGERVRHVNRIKGLLASQGVRDYEPLRRDRRKRLEALRTGDGRPLSPHLKAALARELDRLELLLKQIKAVEDARDALLDRLAEPAALDAPAPAPAGARPSPVAMLYGLKSIAEELAVTLWTEGLSRPFANRRQAGGYTGLTPTPWRSGGIEHEQGVSKAGNQRLRKKLLELAWLWPRHQPDSALARWYRERLPTMTGKAARKRLTVALARKLFIALWKYVTAGVPIEGAVMKAA